MVKLYHRLLWLLAIAFVAGFWAYVVLAVWKAVHP